MSTALESSLGIVAYLVLFAAVGMVFLFVNLLVGWLLRPSNPNEEKLEIYECGERTIGSSFVQFDLRFYVVALLFIIFDVEVAFFFPWATVFGKANDLHDMAQSDNVAVVETLEDSSSVLSEDASYLYRELGIKNAPLPLAGATSVSEGQALVPASLRNHEDIKNATSLATKNKEVIQRGAKQLAWVTTVDIAVFFAILLVGFAYVWKRGDLNWVRAIGTNQPEPQS
jgi:NADH-quinone oxidoreductase subunit A